VPDHFAILGVPRQPWFAPEELKERFLRLSAEAHPDKASNTTAIKDEAQREFQAINEAYNVLRHPRSRLRHLLELEGVAKSGHIENVPALALELFAPIAAVTKQAEALLKEKAAANSPMLKAQFFQKAMPCVDALHEMQQQAQSRLAEMDAEIQQLNPSWRASLPRLTEIAAALGFIERWNAQLQERSTALSF
jgi:curved DNA-binding protein CbpA